MLIEHLIALTLAYVLDLLIGDPPRWPHPVKWIGSAIAFLEKLLNRGRSRKLKGGLLLFIILAAVFSLTFLITFVSRLVHPFLAIAIESFIIFTTIAHRNLKEAALEVYRPLQEGDMNEARRKLSYIVGRDTDSLNEEEIVRGTVETVAENTSDGVTAPLFWGFIGGAPFAILYRAINTCDSMIGYKNEKYFEFGWISAKADDVVNWIPSRLTGFLLLFGNNSHKMKTGKAWHITLRDAKRHPSPNSGWLEVPVAVLLGIQLGGINYYNGEISNRAKMGEPLTSLKKNHIIHTNSILTRTSILFLLVLWIGGILIEVASAWF